MLKQVGLFGITSVSLLTFFLAKPEARPIIAGAGLAYGIIRHQQERSKKPTKKDQEILALKEELLKKILESDIKTQELALLQSQLKNQLEDLVVQKSAIEQERNDLEAKKAEINKLKAETENRAVTLEARHTESLKKKIEKEKLELEVELERRTNEIGEKLSQKYLEKESTVISEYEQRLEEIEIDYASQKAELERKKLHLEEQLAVTYQNRAEQARIRQEQEAKQGELETLWANYQATLQTAQDEMWESLQAQTNQSIQEAIPKIYQAAEAEAKEYIKQQLEIVKCRIDELDEKEKAVDEALKIAAKEYEEKWNEREEYYQNVLKQFTEEANMELEGAKQTVLQTQQWHSRMYQEITKEVFLENHELKQPLLPPPELYEETPKAAMLSERLLKYLYEQKIYTDYVDSYEEKGAVSVLVKHKKGAKNFSESIKTIQKDIPALVTLEQNCNAIPDFGIYQGGAFRFDFDLSGLNEKVREAKAKSKEIDEQPENWLEEVIKSSFHFRVNGQTQAGKSTFVNNLIGLLERLFGKDLEVILIDPKYPFSEWDSIKPKYKGTEDSILGLQAMAEDVQHRLKLATQDADAGRPIRDFNKTLYILDESDTVAGEFNDPTPIIAEYLKDLGLSTKKSVTHLLRQGLKVGAALKVAVCYIGQSPLCSTLGMNKNDFHHSANFFLGENIHQAIEDIAMKHQQPYLRQQLKLRIQRYMENRGTDKEVLYKYYALVKVPGINPFIASLPPKGYYHSEQEYAPVGRRDSDLDPDNPVDRERILKQLETSLNKGEKEPETNEILEWSSNANPRLLVETAKARIISLIQEGVTKPADICRAIWGEIKTQSLPYNGKNGVKSRIEYIIKQMEKG
jgi:hypothetical protein